MANDQKNIFGKRVVTPRGIMSHPHFREPSQMTGKYGVKFLCPKSEVAFIDALNADIKEIAQRAFAGKIKKMSDLLLPVEDGDTGDSAKDEDKGHWILKVSCKNKPVVVGRNPKEPYLDEIYGGIIGRLTTSPMTYDYLGKKGVKLHLESVQIIGGGKRFGKTGDTSMFIEESADAVTFEDDDTIPF